MAIPRTPRTATRGRSATAAYRTAARVALVLVVLLLGRGCARVQPARPPLPAPPPTPTATAAPQAKRMTFEATAYSVRGKTASGKPAQDGVVAADPAVLPLGSRIRVQGAGAYSGEYTVGDTGRTIRGHEIDIFVADESEAERFGRKKVEVEILNRGSGRRAR